MEYSKSYNEVTLQISAWKKNYESRTFDFYEKKSDNLYAIPFM